MRWRHAGDAEASEGVRPLSARRRYKHLQLAIKIPPFAALEHVAASSVASAAAGVGFGNLLALLPLLPLAATCYKLTIGNNYPF